MAWPILTTLHTPGSEYTCRSRRSTWCPVAEIGTPVPHWAKPGQSSFDWFSVISWSRGTTTLPSLYSRYWGATQMTPWRSSGACPGVYPGACPDGHYRIFLCATWILMSSESRHVFPDGPAMCPLLAVLTVRLYPPMPPGRCLPRCSVSWIQVCPVCVSTNATWQVCPGTRCVRCVCPGVSGSLRPLMLIFLHGNKQGNKSR